MDNTRSEQMEKGIDQAKKSYQSPGKLMVLGAIDSVVLSSTHAGNDGSPGTTGVLS